MVDYGDVVGGDSRGDGGGVGEVDEDGEGVVLFDGLGLGVGSDDGVDLVRGKIGVFEEVEEGSA